MKVLGGNQMRSKIAIGLMIVGSALLFVSLTWLLGGREPDQPIIYCTEEASETTPKCPPEPNIVVLAVWQDGSTATVQWSGREWQIRVPGGAFKRVAPPYDWTEL